jgi:enolase-phosphatase E1
MPIHTLKTFRTDASLALLDIEGTTSSLQFVQHILFPYARGHAAEFLTEHWEEPLIQDLADQLLKEAAGPRLADLKEHARTQYELIKPIVDATKILIDRDSKATCLKAIQGMMWEQGYQFGELKSHVYPDVPHALVLWYHQGVRVRVYSSGSIQAQKTFFAHTSAGNLLPAFEDYHDTTTGPKREPDSYRAIARACKLDAKRILFFSDVPLELDAAQAAGMQAVLVVRPDNPPVPTSCTHPRIKSLLQVAFSGPR